jgi:hypothetical protein
MSATRITRLYLGAFDIGQINERPRLVHDHQPPSPSEAQSMVVRKAIRKRSHRSKKVSKGTWSGNGLLQKYKPRF